MDLRHYVRVLLRRWPLLLALALIAGGTAYATSSRAPRLYRATATLSVTPSVVDYFTGEAVQRLLTAYAQRIRSRPFAAEIAPRIGTGARPDDIAGKVQAVAAPSDYRISVQVDDTDASRAQEIANAAAYGFVERLRADTAGRERQDVRVEVLEPAEAPGSPFSPRPRRDALGGAAAGAILGAVIALALELWDDTVRTAAEAHQLLGYQVLGAIPTSHRTGVFNGIIRRDQRQQPDRSYRRRPA